MTSLRTVIEAAHADWHNEHQAVQFSTLLLTRLAEHGMAVQASRPDTATRATNTTPVIPSTESLLHLAGLRRQLSRLTYDDGTTAADRADTALGFLQMLVDAYQDQLEENPA